jgi:hypothetical protein
VAKLALLTQPFVPALTPVNVLVTASWLHTLLPVLTAKLSRCCRQVETQVRLLPDNSGFLTYTD